MERVGNGDQSDWLLRRIERRAGVQQHWLRNERRKEERTKAEKAPRPTLSPTRVPSGPPSPPLRIPSLCVSAP